ncbi:MAG: DUF4384 domain-containing protein [Bacteroidota bacterium]|nr:DUF4384 domain-containing protein [Bacteroidota bacterium]
MKTLPFLPMLAAVLWTTATAIPPARPAVPVPPGIDSDYDIDVWSDRGEGAVYTPGDRIAVYFRADRDCYVVLYDITTEGDVRLLFPRYPDDGFVYGGMTYRLPDYYGEDSWRVSGQRGIEFIHAVASDTPPVSGWEVTSGRYLFDAGPVQGDPFLAINEINRRLFPQVSIRATATTSFFVGGRVWYPRYACVGCHHPRPFLDPYFSVCPRYTIAVAHPYDYWWAYDYHPVRVGFLFAGPFWRFEIRVIPVHRMRRHRYIDCAWGHTNYRPLVIPVHPHTAVVPRHPRADRQRDYTREYRPNLTWDSRTRAAEPRTTGNTRTRPTAVETVEPRDTRVRTTSPSPAESGSTRNRVTTSTPDERTTRERAATLPAAPSVPSSRPSMRPSEIDPTDATVGRERREETANPPPSSGRERSAPPPSMPRTRERIEVGRDRPQPETEHPSTRGSTAPSRVRRDDGARERTR